jgi:antibiotic biosynthesis monooxygenase (ABM) superfamily enzyme
MLSMENLNIVLHVLSLDMLVSFTECCINLVTTYFSIPKRRDTAAFHFY